MALAGRTPAVGSISAAQPPALIISAFRVATLVAVVAFCINPCHPLFGQFTFKVDVFIGAGPTLKRTISLNPSSGPQASTKILSI